MMMTPDVSIVVPAYNQADYLPETLHSLLTQTVGGYEIIVVDDGSTDGTPQIAASFAEEYPQLMRVIRQENRGLAGARNTGIRAANGRFVALLDSDDAWEPTYLAQMLALTEQAPDAAVYYCGVRYIDSNGRSLPQAGSSRVVPADEMSDVMLRANFLVPSTILMRRDAVTAVGLFDPEFRRLQDWELWVRMLQQGYRFAGTAAQLIRYRVHDSSLSTDPDGGQKAAMALAVKNFGPDDGQWEEWSHTKRRMYGGVYRYHALTASLIRAGDWQSCAGYLRRALQIDPSLVDDLDLFYELALGTQPMGRRGASHQPDLEKNAAQIESVIDQIFMEAPPALAKLERNTRGTALYAMGLVAYNAGAFTLSQTLLVRAVRLWPRYGVNRRVVGTWLRAQARRFGVQPPSARDESWQDSSQVEATR